MARQGKNGHVGPGRGGATASKKIDGTGIGNNQPQPVVIPPGPAPTPTPVPSANRRVLGLHVNNLADPGLLLMAARVLPTMLFCPLFPNPQGEINQADLDALTRLRMLLGPDCIIACRYWTSEDTAIAELDKNAQAFGIWFAQQTKKVATRLPDGVVSAWGALNEMPVDRFTKWGQFQMAFNQALAPLPVAAYGFASGSSPLDMGQWQPMLDGLRAPNVKYINTHEYWQSLGVGNLDDTWRQYRVKRSHEALVASDFAQASKAAWIIGEIAYTGSVADGLHGWKSSGLNEMAYAAQLAEYAANVAKLPYVKAAAVFCTDYPNAFWQQSFGVQGSAQVEKTISQN